MAKKNEEKTSTLLDNDAHKKLSIVKVTQDECKTLSDAIRYLVKNQKK